MSALDVMITGMGVVSAAGMSLPETLTSFQTGHRHAGTVSFVETEILHPVFEVTSLPPPEHNMMRTLQLALHAVREALEQAGLSVPIEHPELRIGVCLGTTVACQLNDFDFLSTFRETGRAPMEPVDRFLNGNLAEAVAEHVGVTGPAVTITTACASGTDAIGTGFAWIKQGVCDVVIAGGADELNRVPMAGFNSLSIMSPKLCRPFDRDRQGLNLGEGAGMVILETAESAAIRGVTSNLLLRGYGSACDSYHLTSPRPDGASLKTAIQTALEEARITPADIAFVNAHGTATPENDKVEGKVLVETLGEQVVALSTKGYTGHTLGAAGGLEAVFSATGLREGWVPACAGFEQKDDEIPLVPVCEITEVSKRFALSTSLAFGGGNSAIVIENRT